MSKYLLPLDKLDNVARLEVDYVALLMHKLPRLKEGQKAILLNNRIIRIKMISQITNTSRNPNHEEANDHSSVGGIVSNHEDFAAHLTGSLDKLKEGLKALCQVARQFRYKRINRLRRRRKRRSRRCGGKY